MGTLYYLAYDGFLSYIRKHDMFGFIRKATILKIVFRGAVMVSRIVDSIYGGDDYL